MKLEGNGIRNVKQYWERKKKLPSSKREKGVNDGKEGENGHMLGT
jgi:hypothetical protein